MITVDKIDKLYGRTQILSEICCEFPKGKVSAIIGENGSGKSTLISILGKFLNPNDGGVFIGEEHYSNINRESYALKVSTLRQSNNITAKISVKEFVSFARYPHSKNSLNEKDWEVINECLEILGCASYEHKYLNELSGGQLQRVYLAAVFAQDTPIILLDEPLNNLDLKHAHDLMSIIRNYAIKQQKTIVIIMHDINMVYQYADYCMALKNGKIVHCGSIDSFKSADVLHSIYDLNFEFLQLQHQCIAYLKEENV